MVYISFRCPPVKDDINVWINILVITSWTSVWDVSVPNSKCHLDDIHIKNQYMKNKQNKMPYLLNEKGHNFEIFS